MKKHLKALVFVAVFIGFVVFDVFDGAIPLVAFAQERAEGVVPLKIQVVISRSQGDRRISSMPYSLSVNAPPQNPVQVGSASLRMGAKIPVVMMQTPVIDGKPMASGGPIQYQDVGTNIDCATSSLDGGRFRVQITVDDTSVYTEEQGKKSDNPTFRSFRATDSMVLKDGQSAEFTAATDKISGEVTRVAVTLTVLK